MGSAIRDQLRIGIDIGGTFTDFVIFDPSTKQINTLKILSTPENPAQAVMDGLHQIRNSSFAAIVHGSTVATNALLERKGARAALVATQGFKDILLIGRQNRPSLYDWTATPPEPLIPSELSFEINERVDHHGQVLIPLDEHQVSSIVAALQGLNVQSIAISFLFSFLHPQHEQLVAEKLRAAGFLVSTSAEIIPEYREYERTSTTAVNAYVSPTLNKYLDLLKEELPHTQIQVMQSNGGMISLKEARANGVRCILSGPAGGVIGAQNLARISNFKSNLPGADILRSKLITFDMGGTSTDVSLIYGASRLTNEAIVGGCPISIPILDIHTIGAGGGSIAYVDQGGALRVGPQSAGANPGPACYGRGEFPTVTDANLVLGRLIPESFLNGQMRLEPDRSWHSLQRLGADIGLDAVQTALGIISVVNAHMERALRLISVERGYDPREFTLFSFGGAGGLHAADLARNLNIPTVLISPYASVLSAFGMLVSNVVRDYVQTVMLSGATPVDQINKYLNPLASKGLTDILSEGVVEVDIVIQKMVDARYVGQSYELTVPFTENWVKDFHAFHSVTYGYQRPEMEVELVNVRVRAVGKISPPQPIPLPKTSTDPKAAQIASRQIIYPNEPNMVPFYQHDLLQPGNQISGPAITIRPDTTIMIGDQDTLDVDEYQNLIVHIG